MPIAVIINDIHQSGRVMPAKSQSGRVMPAKSQSGRDHSRIC